MSGGPPGDRRSSVRRKKRRPDPAGREGVCGRPRKGLLHHSDHKFSGRSKRPENLHRRSKSLFDRRRTAWRQAVPFAPRAQKGAAQQIAMRPKRVGYWKASYIKVPYPPYFVNRKFCRFRSFFVGYRRSGGERDLFVKFLKKETISPFHFNTNMLYYTKGAPRARARLGRMPSGPLFTRKERSR